ncbi:hypothetical protein K3G39_10255 [Pontibacter sp. HSC-14F20]|uniref:hypothetical protein n=1 Tax=Pontibacter sp. HSC-14F20 TaxID=2864136 RepID=UPI001C72E185|nr:hypothetical protein [Pontibacter sp. HSC-14F20]MBX0333619.1 hypothetical protein [Pontibacter sp. HSC-14F20]
MKRLILQSTLTPQLLLYGGMALIMWPTALRMLGTLNFENNVSPAFLYAGIVVMLVGVALRVYQEKQAGSSVVKGYLFRVVAGIAIATMMMLTGIIKTPAFLQNLFQG